MPKEILQYETVNAVSVEELDTKVQEALKKGLQPWKRMSTATIYDYNADGECVPSYTEYYQTMVKYGSNEL